ncbi:TPA: hypothetical protein PXR40_001569 [Yersinia enterocolitica]|nr:hypothetical protein [Yersinia enterocolitica]
MNYGNGHNMNNPNAVPQMSAELPLSILLTQRCIKFANSQRAVDIIDNGIACLFKQLTDETFSTESDFSKDLSGAFKAALPTNLSNILELQHYNALIIKSIREAWASSDIGAEMVERMTDLVEEFTHDQAIPKYILASDLWAAFIEENATRAVEEQWKKPQVVVTQFDNGDHIWIGLHPEYTTNTPYPTGPKSSAHECDFMLAFSAQYRLERDSKTAILYDGKPAYSLFAGYMDRGTLGKSVIKPYSRFDRLILALYYGGSLLLWDKSPEGLRYPGNE